MLIYQRVCYTKGYVSGLLWEKQWIGNPMTNSMSTGHIWVDPTTKCLPFSNGWFIIVLTTLRCQLMLLWCCFLSAHFFTHADFHLVISGHLAGYSCASVMDRDHPRQILKHTLPIIIITILLKDTHACTHTCARTHMRAHTHSHTYTVYTYIHIYILIYVQLFIYVAPPRP